MEKQWVEDITKSPQCQNGLIYRDWLDTQPFEDTTVDFDDSEFYDSDDSLNIGIPPKPILQENLIRFVKQIRESRGYDVDVSFPGSLLRPLDMKKLKNDRVREDLMRGLNAAMENINAESEKETGKTYEFVEFKNIVLGEPFYCLFTFTARVRGTDVVKTLQSMVYAPYFEEPIVFEWRVKPESSASDSTEGSP